MIPRLVKPLLSNSFFLFGARGTGKTFFLKEYLRPERTLTINLLRSQDFDELSLRPDALRERIKAFSGELDFVFIDEIQKVPKLLDVVHDLIESENFVFALSGSSARKLKRGGANLLAGRAFQNYLFPLTAAELQALFSLPFALNWGNLPKLQHFSSDQERSAYLRTYVDTYIKEEILQEQIVRNLVPFKRFLDVAAQSSGRIVNYSAIARDIQATDKTVRSYFQILEDTLLGRFLEPYYKSARKRQRQSPKFYFFDTGVMRAITKSLELPLRTGTYEYGRAFEHFLFHEINARKSYLYPDYEFFYLASAEGAEVDLVIERPGLKTLLVEIKSKTMVTENDLRHLRSFKGDVPEAESLCLSQDPSPKEIDGVACVPWEDGLELIFPKRS